MIKLLITAVISLLIIFIGGCNSVDQKPNIETEKAEISKVIHNSIGWAKDKDKELSYSCYAHDPELFWFSPKDNGTVQGFDAFANVTENFFMLDDFKAVRYEIKDLKINLSNSGEVAWFHARLDDYNTWKGQPANWEDVRWTGVLEKQNGHWVIVQMHFSDPSDRT